MNILDTIDQLPFELAHRLESDEFFVDIPVIVADNGDVAAEAARKQAIVTKKSGKYGVSVVVLQIMADDANPNMPFGPLRLKPAFQVVENVELNNNATTGTKKSHRRVARRVIMVIKTCRLFGVANCINCDKPAIEIADFKDQKLVGSQVNFVVDEGDTEIITKVATPSITQVTTTAVLACTTAGAAIYYTTDDSYPSLANNATLYTVPVNVTSTSIIRAGAYKTGSVPSDINRSTFT